MQTDPASRPDRARAKVKAVAICGVLMLSGCAEGPGPGPGAGGGPPFPPWQSKLLRDHPLAGRIWLPAERRYLTPEELLGRMARAKYVALGERHDNADHHRIQAWITQALIRGGAKRALVMEMFREGQQQAIDAHLKSHPKDSAGLAKAAGWAGSGWPAWSHYEPIVRPAVERGLPVIAANISRRRVKAIYRDGLAALGADRVRTLGLDRPMAPALLTAMDREIADAHCGMLKAASSRPFTRIQVARDALFAAAMVQGARAVGGAILIAGAGHTRTDRGVPYHLRRSGAAASEMLSLGLIEVADGENQPHAYAGTFAVGRLPFDAVWFTPGHARGDPCEKFKSTLKK